MSFRFLPPLHHQARRYIPAGVYQAIKERPLTVAGIAIGEAVFPGAVGGVGVAMLGGAVGVPAWLIGSGKGAAVGSRADKLLKASRVREELRILRMVWGTAPSSARFEREVCRPGSV